MGYKTIFDTKPKKDNKISFCNRIVNFLDSIVFCDGDYVYNDGKKMINCMFKYNKLNKGYSDIDDLLNEADVLNKNIFDLCDSQYISEDELFANIDIIANCLYGFEPSSDRYFYNEADAIKTITIIFEAMNQYLLSCGYKLVGNSKEQQFFIIENEVSIDIENIKDKKLKDEIISFYDYKNAKDIDEKKKIMLILIGNLESRKNDIENIMGKKIADMFGNYVNNFNIRHNNISESYRSHYRKTIAAMSNEELLRWYDYIFAFMINIYMGLDKLKNVNINDDYK